MGKILLGHTVRSHHSGKMEPCAFSCPVNDEPAADGMTMAEVMELYARDNGVWVKDFMEVFQVNSIDISMNPQGALWQGQGLHEHLQG